MSGMLVKTIGQPFLSYDNHSLVNGEVLDYFYTNLEIVRRLGIDAGRKQVDQWPNCEECQR